MQPGTGYGGRSAIEESDLCSDQCCQVIVICLMWCVCVYNVCIYPSGVGRRKE